MFLSLVTTATVPELSVLFIYLFLHYRSSCFLVKVRDGDDVEVRVDLDNAKLLIRRVEKKKHADSAESDQSAAQLA